MKTAPALLLALALAAPAAAQPYLLPGDPVYLCGDRLCNPGYTREVRQAGACDPWADGRFDSTDPADLACWRTRYGYTYGPGAEGGQHGQWSLQISEGYRHATGSALTSNCLDAAPAGRAFCDILHTLGFRAGCVASGCGEWPDCPPLGNACPLGPGPVPVDGWHRDALLTLPAAYRPPAVRVRNQGSGPADGCAWSNPAITPPRELWVRFNRANCFDGMPPDCRSVAGLTAACWAPEPPPGPVCGDGTCDPAEDCVNCAADCGPCPPPPPGIVLLRHECDGGSITVEVGVAGEVHRLSQPSELCPPCPAADLLGQVCGLACGAGP